MRDWPYSEPSSGIKCLQVLTKYVVCAGRGHSEGFHIPLYLISTVATIQHTARLRFQGYYQVSRQTLPHTTTTAVDCAFCVWLHRNNLFAIKINPLDLAFLVTWVPVCWPDLVSAKEEYVELYLDLAHICSSTVTLPSIICHMKGDTMRPTGGGAAFVNP